MVAGLMKENKLLLAPDKTKTLIVKKRRKLQKKSLLAWDIVIHPKMMVKYPRLRLKYKLYNTEHVRRVIESAKKFIKIIPRIFANVGCLRFEKSKILYKVMNSIIHLWSLSIWTCTTRVTRIWWQSCSGVFTE